jgi:hypothetical protein
MRVIELPFDAGGTICFEVDEPTATGKTFRGEIPKTLDRLDVSFESVVSKLKPVVETIAGSLTGLVNKPDSVEIEFEVKLTADAGVVIAKAGSETSLKIKLGWKPSTSRQS